MNHPIYGDLPCCWQCATKHDLDLTLATETENPQ